MSNYYQDIAHLLFKRLSGAATAVEQEALERWLQANDERKEFVTGLEDSDGWMAYMRQVRKDQDNHTESMLFERIRHQISMLDENGTKEMDFQAFEAPVHRVQFLKTAWFRWAAVLLLIAGTATLLYQINRPQKDSVTKQPTTITPDIQPGGNKAILTLADGSNIVLDSAANGSLAQQGNTKIIKLDAGKLAYQGNDKNGVWGFNTIKTPKGGQYQVVLPDGTKVWLNAASSITFPTAFPAERQVSVTGEVYFETTPDKSKPFLVKAKDINIKVLGTSFNVNAYEDEQQLKVALAAGSIRIGTAILQPGQAFINGAVCNTNLQQDLAWKNGLFSFNHADISTVMRQLARWYNITVIYSGAVPVMQFTGEMDRSLPLSQVFETLAETGVKYRIEDSNKIIILP